MHAKEHVANASTVAKLKATAWDSENSRQKNGGRKGNTFPVKIEHNEGKLFGVLASTNSVSDAIMPGQLSLQCVGYSAPRANAIVNYV